MKDFEKIKKTIDVETQTYGKLATMTLLEKFLEGFEGKNILDIGCGIGMRSNNDFYPDIGNAISDRGGIVYGMDKGFIGKDDSYLEKFREETGIIPVPGTIETIDKVFNEEFDGIISNAVMGHPTRDLNWIEGMKKLYSLTKKNGYHCHHKFYNEDFNVSEEELEQIGFNVLNYFKNNRNGSTLVLYKE